MSRRVYKQRGQAMLLAVVAMVILAIGMYTTYSLSRAVYEKIQLQNAADATAYSLATLEARTFNFIAFSNRAQVANYVQMMEAQTMLSNATYAEFVAGTVGDVLLFGAKATELFPAISGPLRVAGQSAKLLSQSLGGVRKALDEVTPGLVRLLTSKNYVLFSVSLSFTLATASQILDGGQAIAIANDPDARYTTASYALNALNVASFQAAYDWSGSIGSNNSDARKAARRMMTELVNASRHGSNVADFVVGRPPHALLLELLAPVIDLDAGILGDIISGPIESILSAGFVGTTKMVADDAMPSLDVTKQNQPGSSALNLGGAMLAKDHFFLFPDGFANVIATPNASKHCYYKMPEGSYGTALALFRMVDPPFECEPEGEKKHQWNAVLGLPGGITPYLQFAPKQSGVSVERVSFNQPDVWILLSKGPNAMASKVDLNFSLTQGGQTANFDGRAGEDGLFDTNFAKGFHALARAQVYYHRPGAWQEPPNFFNPFWSARLAPKGAAISGLAGRLGIDALPSSLVADNVWMF